MRILMLHGYAQTGDTFRRKLRRLESAIRESHPDASFVYLDGPMKLDVDDMTESKPTLYGDINKNRRLDLRAWFRLPLIDGHDPATGLLRSLDYLATVLEHHGPFDGIIAFSQGTVLGGLICSLLQDKETRDVIDSTTNLGAMERPESFLNIKHPPIKFGIFYASRVLTGEYYDWLYDASRMNTSFCHFFGLLDSMVGDEEQDEVTRVMCRGKSSRTYYHPGGHFVPSDRFSNDIAVNFINRHMATDGTTPTKTLGRQKTVQSLDWKTSLLPTKARLQRSCSESKQPSIALKERRCKRLYV